MRKAFHQLTLALLSFLGTAAHAEALSRAGITATVWRSADFGFERNGEQVLEGSADLVDVTLAAPLEPDWFLTARARHTESVVGTPWLAGPVEEWRLALGAGWLAMSSRNFDIGLGGDVIVANIDGRLPDTRYVFDCISAEPCAFYRSFSQTDWGAELTGALAWRAGNAIAVLASAGYQLLGNDAGRVLRASLSFGMTDNVRLHLSWFEEPRVQGVGGGMQFRFGR